MKTNDKLYIIHVDEDNQIVDYSISEIKSFNRDKAGVLFVYLYPIIGDQKSILFSKRFNVSCLKSVYRSFDYGTYKTYFTISKKAFLNLLNTFNIETLPEE